MLIKIFTELVNNKIVDKNKIEVLIERRKSVKSELIAMNER